MSFFIRSIKDSARQFAALCHKNVIVARRNWKGTIVQIVSPVLLVVLLVAFQHLSNFILSKFDEYPQDKLIAAIPKCVSKRDCVTVLYTPVVPWVENIMKKVALDNYLQYGIDIKPLESSGILEEEGISKDNKTIINYLMKNPNTTQNVIMFTSAYYIPFGDIPPPKVGYMIYYNWTEAYKHNYHSPAEEVMHAIDEAVLRIKTGNPNASLKISSHDFPTTKPRINSFDITAQTGGIWFFIPSSITFFIILTEMVLEKEKNLRLSMQVMGLKGHVYWLSWFSHGFFFTVSSSLVLIASGYIFGLEVFTNSSIWVLLLTFVLHGTGLLCFALLLSTIVRTSKTAQSVGYIFTLIGFVFQVLLCSAYGLLIDMMFSKTVPSWVTAVRYIFTLYPSFNFSKLFTDIAFKSANTINLAGGEIIKGKEFSWNNLYDSRTIHQLFNMPDLVLPPPIHSVYALIINIVAFILITAYLDQIFTYNRPWYFFVTFFWRPKKGLRQSISGLGDVESLSVNDDIKVIDLAKTYGSLCGKTFKAVDGVSFGVKQGEVFCILGPNGAGKTTTLSMLTGVVLPDESSGHSSIFGYDLISQMPEIRKIMGVVPQYDTLWDELTAFEHMRLFSKIKGVELKNSEHEIAEKLKQVGLFERRSDLVGSFSGGMKRRISIAIATLGNPKVLYLDEPSTGMDPVNRSDLWALIQNVKRESAVILTTHSLEEADILSDRIAIMVFGKIRCAGNSLYLKSKYGLGYTISIITNPVNANSISADALKWFPDCTIVNQDECAVNLKIPQTNTNNSKIPQFLELMEQYTSEEKVREWGLSHTTLEEVFLNVTKENGFSYDDKIETKAVPDTCNLVESDLLKYHKVGIRSYPYRALIRKNFSIQKRETCNNVLQLATPFIAIFMMLVIHKILQVEIGGYEDGTMFVPSIPWPLNSDPNVIIPFPWWSNRTAIPRDPNGHCLQFFYFSDATHEAGDLNNWGTTNKKRLLGKIKQHKCDLSRFSSVQTPYFLKKNSTKALDREIFDELTALNKVPMGYADRGLNTAKLADGIVSFKLINTSTCQFEYSYSVNDNQFLTYHRANNFTRMGLVDMDIFEPTYLPNQVLLIITQGRLAMMSMMNDAFMSLLFEKELSKDINWDLIGSVIKSLFLHKGLKWTQSMPFRVSIDDMGWMEIMGSIVYPICLTIQLPMYIYILVMEKTEKLRDMMECHGMRPLHYLSTNFLFNFVIYVIVTTFFWLTGWVMNVRFFVQTSPSLLGVFFVGWGLALIALSFLLSMLINSKRSAIVVGYIIALIGSLVGVVFCIGIYGHFSYSISDDIPSWLLLWPQFAFIRGIYLMNDACANDMSCYSDMRGLGIQDEITKVTLFLYGDALAIFILAIYWEYRISIVGKLISRLKKRNRSQPLLILEDEPLLFEYRYSTDDESVEQERKIAHNPPSQHHYSLLTRDMSKKYGKKQALNNLSLAIQEGALLGENGAGKSTFISICTGQNASTSGYGLIANYDTRTQMESIRLVIGVTPQFSVVWDTLTVEEHLLFYCRMKGIHPQVEREHVEGIMNNFGLYQARSKLAKELSGGTKRRLSIAIALAGDSSLIFLDEPTTGLDPVSRIQIWKLLNNSKKNRAMLLATHSMEEAEVLSNRIGILSQGSLKCIGSSLNLKNRFAKGYNLQVNFQPENEVEVVETVKTLFPDAEETDKEFHCLKEFTLSSSTYKISQIFLKMDNFMKDSTCITDWCLSQITLEKVFQSIVKQNRQ